MHRFHLNTNIHPPELTRLTASPERSTPWIQQLLECHYYRPLAIARNPFERRTSVAEPMVESDPLGS